MALFNYNPEAVNVLVAGLVPITGFVAGTFISARKDEEAFKLVRTSDGFFTRIDTEGDSWSITLTLHRGSPSNDMLTQLWNFDRATKQGKFPLIIKDSSGSDLIFATNSWIERTPQVDHSDTIDSRVWLFRCTNTYVNFGNNENPTDMLSDILNVGLSAVAGSLG